MTYGLGNGRQDSVTTKFDAELRRGQEGEVPTVVPSPSEIPGSADLAELLACWATLPEDVKTGLVAMVRAAAK